MRSRALKIMMLGAAGVVGIGLYRAVDAAATSVRGDGTVDIIIALVTLLLCIIAMAYMRRGMRPERPHMITMRRFLRWSLGAAMPLLVLSAARAPFTETYEAVRQNYMRTDLHNLVAIEEKAAADSGHFTANPVHTRSPGISNPEITLVPNGWTAQVKPSVTARYCTIFIGDTPLPPARLEGEPRCTKAELNVKEIIQGLVVMAIGLAAGYAIVQYNRRRLQAHATA
jgi:hypothetical protein